MEQAKIPQIKICGLTSPEEAQWCMEERVNYTGMVVFYPKSKRNIGLDRAKELLAVLHGRKPQEDAGQPEGAWEPPMRAAAVTVSPTPEQVERIQEAGFDLLQVHGALSREAFAQIRIPMIRAFNGLDRALYEEFHHCPKVEAYLFDGKVPGSGETFDWDILRQIPRDEKPFFLAGGLTADNVQEAIRRVRPDVVDVSSGVEAASPGVGKDREKIRTFVRKVRSVNGSRKGKGR
ncbi:MAG: phosphoribosylanthranilate isomerase [Clostridiales bacterium]|nr:phosphoribosylanthranilate isomerase [Clostridiales bacterium]